MDWLNRIRSYAGRIRAYFDMSERSGFGGSGWYSQTGVPVTEETAMRCSTVLACIRVITEDVSSLPLTVAQKTPQGWVEQPDHPVSRLLSRGPNPYMTSSELRQRMIVDTLTHGHAANWIVRNAKGDVVAIYPLQAGLLTLQGPVTLSAADVRTGMADLRFQYGGIEYGKRNFSSFDLWRCNLLPPSYLNSPNLEQFSLILLAREAIGLAQATEFQGAKLFRNGIQSTMALISPSDLDKEHRDSLRDSFDPNKGWQNAWKPLILENGMTLQKIGLTAVESQFLESRQFQLADIA